MTNAIVHQFHAKVMSLVLWMRAGRQGDSTPPVWGEMLLLQLCIQAAGERHLEIYTELLLCMKVTFHSMFIKKKERKKAKGLF